MHESGWLVYKFQSEEDKWSVLSKGPYLVYGRPLILRSMSEYFNFSSSEMYQVPVWIQFPYLPLKCWTPLCLSKLANVLGKPLQCDKFTATKERISYARVLVEVDLLADLRSSINVSLPNGNSLIQKVIYETLPKFCKHCKVLGHSTGTCSKGKEEGKNFEQAGPAATKSNAKVNGYDSTHKLAAAAATWSNGGEEHIPSCNVDKVVSSSAATNAKDKGNGHDSTHKLVPATWSNGGEEQIKRCNVDKAASSSAAAKAKDKDNGNGSTPLQLDVATCFNEELLAAAKCSNEKLPACPSSAAHKDNDKDHVNVSTQLPLAAATCSIGKACAALKSHVNDRGNDLNHVVAPSVEVPPIAPPSADGPELVAPADAWQIVQKRRQSSRNKQQTHSFLPAECNPPAQQKVSKGKTPVPSVDIAGIKAPHCPGVGVLTRSSVQKNSNPFSGSGGVPPTIPHP